MDARERIRKARQEAELSENIETLVESAIESQQATVLKWITRSLAPVVSSVERELREVERAQKEAAGILRSEIGYTRSEIARNRREIQQERWIAAILCFVIALIAGGVGFWSAPVPSPESLRLQDLGSAVEQRYREMTKKERAQLDKLMGWREPTERRTQ